MKIGAGELLVVFIVALFVIGPDRLPEYARRLGKALAAFKTASQEATDGIKKSVVEPLEEVQEPLREAAEPINEVKNSVEKNLNDVKRSMNNIGKNEKQQKKESADRREKNYESGNAGTGGDSDRCADHLRTVPDSEAHEDAGEEREGL